MRAIAGQLHFTKCQSYQSLYKGTYVIIVVVCCCFFFVLFFLGGGGDRGGTGEEQNKERVWKGHVPHNCAQGKLKHKVPQKPFNPLTRRKCIFA